MVFDNKGASCHATKVFLITNAEDANTNMKYESFPSNVDRSDLPQKLKKKMFENAKYDKTFRLQQKSIFLLSVARWRGEYKTILPMFFISTYRKTKMVV